MSAKEETIAEQISTAIENSKYILNLEESRKIMELSGIPFNKSGFATTEDETAKIAEEIGYPVVLKIVSPQVVHKTEAGGVKIGIEDEEELRKAYNDIMKSVKEKVPDADIKGISIDEMVKGTELIIGTTVDPQFGHMIMFGIGGIFVEIYEDVSFRLVPINAGDAMDMLDEIKGRPLLQGARGLPKADDKQLVDILLKVSNLVDKHPDIQEMDLNPLMITERGVLAVDARVILNNPKKDDTKDFRAMIEDIKKYAH
jgi:acyl-CoA synthetase (NDP forming)